MGSFRLIPGSGPVGSTQRGLVGTSYVDFPRNVGQTCDRDGTGDVIFPFPFQGIASRRDLAARGSSLQNVSDWKHDAHWNSRASFTSAVAETAKCGPSRPAAADSGGLPVLPHATPPEGLRRATKPGDLPAFTRAPGAGGVSPLSLLLCVAAPEESGAMDDRAETVGARWPHARYDPREVRHLLCDGDR